MTFTSSELDPTDPATVPALLPLLQAGMAADSPLHPEPTEPFARWLFNPLSVRHRTCVVADDDGSGRAVGSGQMQHDNDTNRDMVHGDIWIAPQDRAEATVPLLDAFRAHGRRRGASGVVLAVSGHAADYEPIFTAEVAVRPLIPVGIRLRGRSQRLLRALDRPRQVPCHGRVTALSRPSRGAQNGS